MTWYARTNRTSSCVTPCPDRSQPGPGAQDHQFCPEGIEARAVCCGKRMHHHVRMHLRPSADLACTDKFSQASLDTVAVNRGMPVPRHDDSGSTRPRCFHEPHIDQTASKTPPILSHPRKLPALCQATFARESVRVRRRRTSTEASLSGAGVLSFGVGSRPPAPTW